MWNSRGLAAMSHVTLRQSHRRLSGRLNLFPQGDPTPELLVRILQCCSLSKLVGAEDEASRVPRTPMQNPPLNPRLGIVANSHKTH